MIPEAGFLFDGANALWYTAEGNYGEAAISAASAAMDLVPGGGIAAKVGKYGSKAVRAVVKHLPQPRPLAHLADGRRGYLASPTNTPELPGTSGTSARRSSSPEDAPKKDGAKIERGQKRKESDGKEDRDEDGLEPSSSTKRSRSEFAGTTKINDEGDGEHLVSDIRYHSPDTFLEANKDRRYLYRSLNPAENARLGNSGGIPSDFRITANNPDANFSPVRHVGDANYQGGTQFISTGNDRGAALNNVLNSNGLSVDSRLVRNSDRWTSIVEIDVSKLPPETRLYDMSKDWEEYFRGQNVYTRGNAFADQEVLIQGTIESSAIRRVEWGFEERLSRAGVSQDRYFERFPRPESEDEWG
ncbi:hypothetical protein [Burkholderia ubonensis]|uniref:hypothetical protein n=1 Tax=Burkholderia ubonensis TaxID=101571 RepID=UPI0012FC20EA|nr:hypothetical protein [Burkholderia ubonensis]